MSGMVGITDLDAAKCVPIKSLPVSCVSMFELRPLISSRRHTTTFRSWLHISGSRHLQRHSMALIFARWQCVMGTQGQMET
jgi:hypothetical protein